jgi:hypothetical protein
MSLAILHFAVSKRSPLLSLLARSTGLEVGIKSVLINGFHRRQFFPALFLPLKYLTATSFPAEEEYLRHILGMF